MRESSIEQAARGCDALDALFHQNAGDGRGVHEESSPHQREWYIEKRPHPCGTEPTVAEDGDCSRYGASANASFSPRGASEARE